MCHSVTISMPVCADGIILRHSILPGSHLLHGLIQQHPVMHDVGCGVLRLLQLQCGHEP